MHQLLWICDETDTAWGWVCGQEFSPLSFYWHSGKPLPFTHTVCKMFVLGMEWGWNVSIFTYWFLIFHHKIHKWTWKNWMRMFEFILNHLCLIADNIWIVEILKRPHLGFSSRSSLSCAYHILIWMLNLYNILCNTTTLYLILHSFPSYSSHRSVFLPVLTQQKGGRIRFMLF